MIEIFGRRNSVNVQKVLWWCTELQLTFEVTEVGGPFGRTREPWYIQMNPNALVPVIRIDGFVLWESNAILRYLDGSYREGALRVEDARQRAIADQWMDWASSVIMDRSRMPTVFIGLVRTPPAARDVEAIKRAADSMADAWRILDAHLASEPFVAGGRFSVGDIPAGILAYRWFSMDLERPDMPNLRRWVDRLEARPAFRSQIAGPLT